ncbi:sarcosine oxidase subunit delta [Oceanospirillum sp.]|uniref:sarcosine oxidase subunit delta n=1 Tax=Oceanospirillum sp. TaxID=2021254 RepID=UPI003A95A275
MKMMTCPLNGLRNINEFVFGGEVTALPDLQATDQAWAEYTFYKNNSTGVVREWWYHSASGYWFVAERDRTSEQIIRTYDSALLADEVTTTQFGVGSSSGEVVL